jgi:aminoglycoside N3'-acetyltransferase
VSRRELVAQLRALGVAAGGVLLVHVSFRAVRPVEGGPEGLVAAIREALGPGGTLVMPSWLGDEDELFDPRSSAAAPDLGAVADVFWRLPGVVRSEHPQAFAAVGPHAAAVVQGRLPIPPHVPESPVGRVRDLDGQVLLLGVGHEADTTVHLAELVAGVPYRLPRWFTVEHEGRRVRVDYEENDHCGDRFALVGEWLAERGLQREGRVGHARALLARSRDVVEVVVERLRREPLVFLHPEGEGCGECDEARGSVSGRG